MKNPPCKRSLRVSVSPAAQRVGALQEPGGAAAAARLAHPHALQRAAGQRLGRQPGAHGAQRLQAQAALKQQPPTPHKDAIMTMRVGIVSKHANDLEGEK